MKVAMVLGASLGMLPWNYFYLDELMKNGCEVTVISWNREGIGNEGIDKRIVLKEYTERIDNSIHKIRKIGPFRRFRKYAAAILKENDFDLVIISTLQISMLFYDLLRHKYRRKYIYDVRDPWIEGKKFIRRISNQIVKNSVITFISSEAYKRWLPKDSRIVVTHNVRFQDKSDYECAEKTAESDVIRIVFWGITREIETNIRFIKLIANDERFKLDYYGVLLEEAKAVFTFCEDNHINNVEYKGEFPPNGRMKIAKNTDLIHDIYTSRREGFDTRMFNKYYDGVVFEIPQITYSSGFVGQCVEKYGVGLSISLQDGDADRIYQYYQNLDREQFHINCQLEQKRIAQEMQFAKKKLNEVIRDLQ